MKRRQWSQWAVCASLAPWALSAQANNLNRSQAAPAASAPERFTIYIPGSSGGGWDQTGRALGAALQAQGLVGEVAYVNKGGKGGLPGLAEFVQRHDRDPHAIFVGGMVMLGAIAVQRPAIALNRVQPLARLTTEHLMLATTPKSGFKDVAALAAAMKQDLSSVVFTGGSAGGIDHMMIAMVARQLRLDLSKLNYLPTGGGGEALELLLAGKAQVVVSGVGELQRAVATRQVLPLALSSRRGTGGVPSLTDRGIHTELANWRGVFCGGGLTPTQNDRLIGMLRQATDSQAWRRQVRDNRWQSAQSFGPDFAELLLVEQAIANAVTHMLRLQA
ncbi:Bug family tripartite tricarboxylate transporter substrate binding protein [Roseateles sp. BYS180W]|uniref:Bug family tripartite tricarboxylate transporter substrate binding protein n=1 Tax=Roseateles rivi TaxID=3299028 RepID=A0ABW7FUB7_9BURK